MPKLSIDIEARFAQAMDALDALGRKADTQARLITTAFRGVGGVLTAAFGAVSFAAIERVADSIAAYQDLADQIGDTASAVSSLQLAADLSGTSLQEVAQASARATATFAKGGAEARNSASALEAINIQLEEFKGLSPVEQLERVAQELSKFEDGAGKTAVAIQLFGRSGAQLIPFFNDLAEAGRENSRLTEEQIKAADDFTKGLARMRSELARVGQSVVGDVLPAFNRLLAKFNELRGSGTGIADSLVEALLPKYAQEELRQRIDYWLKQRDRLLRDLENPPFIFRNDDDWAKRQRESLEKANAELQVLIKKRNDILNGDRLKLPELDDPLADTKPRLKFEVPETDKGQKARQTEAQKILESLERQQEKLAELNIYEQTALDLAKARNKEYSGLTPEIEKQILARAREVQAQADAMKADKARQEQEREGFERFLAHIQAVEKLADSYRDLIDPAEQYRKKLREITELEDSGKLSGVEANMAREKILDQMGQLDAKTDKPFDEMSVYADQAARNIQTAFADYLFDPFDEGVEGMLEKFSVALRRMAAEVAAAQIIDYIKSWAMSNIGSSGSSFNTTGTTFRAIEGGADAVYGAATKSEATAPQVTVNVNGQGPQLTQAEFQRVVRDAVRNGMRETALRNG